MNFQCLDHFDFRVMSKLAFKNTLNQLKKNSFFQDYVDKGETLKSLRLKLSDLENGVNLMITHQVVIRAITGSSSRSGEFIAFNTKTKASINVILN